MTDKLKEKVGEADKEKKKIFDNIENNSFTSDLIDSLSRFYDLMRECRMKEVNSLEGSLRITGFGIIINVAGSKKEYYFCPKSKEITKLASDFTTETIQIK